MGTVRYTSGSQNVTEESRRHCLHRVRHRWVVRLQKCDEISDAGTRAKSPKARLRCGSWHNGHSPIHVRIAKTDRRNPTPLFASCAASLVCTLTKVGLDF